MSTEEKLQRIHVLLESLEKGIADCRRILKGEKID